MECICLLGLHESWIPRAVFDHKDNILKLDHGIKIIPGKFTHFSALIVHFVTKMGGGGKLLCQKGQRCLCCWQISGHALSL